jgi:hypothetical protein
MTNTGTSQDYCGCCGGPADEPPKGEHDACCSIMHDLEH